MFKDPKNCLYVSDLDGTLLDPHSEFSAESTDRLNRLIDDGLMFTIATARSYESTHPILSEVNLEIPVILFNGVYLTDFHSGRNLELCDFIPHNVVHSMIQMVDHLSDDPFVYAYGSQNRLYYRNVTNHGSQEYLKSLEGDGRLHRVEHYEFLENEAIAGFLLIDTPEALQPVHDTLLRQFPRELNLYFAEDIAHPGYYWLQAFHKKANKGSMLDQLAEQLGIPMNRVVVFGDYLNDLEMFKIAGKSIAVANALPEVKQAAHEVIGSNAEGAVLNYLETVWYGSPKKVS
ncbi:MULTISPECIES: HAD family hydrolase [unclassified Nitrospina]|uniref:HAD family hydrolase n=1 Tax=unclassified Nitrospina TaxID=2638683 RepID=UPI003F996DAC